MAKRNRKPSQLSFDFSASGEIEQLRTEINRVKIENDRLRSENALLVGEVSRLKELLPIKAATAQIESETTTALIYAPQAPAVDIVTKHSPIEHKIKLFRQYFKGREDVYAVRATDKQGKGVYFPKRQYLGQENGKHVWGDYLPLTDDMIKSHLQDEDHTGCLFKP